MPVFQIGLDDGRSLRIEADDQEAALAGVQHFQDTEKANAPSGAAAGFSHGISGVASGIASTLGLGGVKSDTLDGVAAETEPKDFHSAPLIREGGKWYNPSDWQPGNIPQFAAEMAPGLATDVLAGKVGASVGSKVAGVRGGVIGGIGAGLGSFALRNFGPGAHANAEARTGDANAPVTGADMGREGLKELAQAPLNAMGGFGRFLPSAGKAAGVGLEGAGSALRKYLTTAADNAGTAGVNDFINQKGTSLGQDYGKDYDPNQTAQSMVGGGIVGGALASPKLASEVHGASKDRAFGGENTAATAQVANRIKDAADGGNISSPKAGGEAFATARTNIHSELKDAAGNLETPLSPDAQSVIDRATAGKKLTDTDFTRLAKDVATDPDGDAVVALARQAHVAAMLKDQGEVKADGTFIGGITNSVGKHIRAIANPIGVGTAAVLDHTIGGGAGAALLGAHSLPALGAIAGGYAGMRGIDALTGMRSPANRFANKFADDSGVHPAAPVAPTPPPATTSVPQIAPPQDTQLWGAPQPPVPNLRPTLNANAKVEEGMAKIAGKLQAQKRKDLIGNATPLLRQLAIKIKPVTADVPAQAPAAVSDAPASPAIASLMQKLNASGQAAAPPAPATPAPPSGLMAAAPAAPAAPPISPEMPQAPLIAKISKKLNGSVKETPHPEADQPYMPIPAEGLYRKNMTDDEMVVHEFSKYSPSKKKAYEEKSLDTREGNRNDTLGTAADHSPGEIAVAKELYHQLDHIHRPAQARKALAHYTSRMSPHLGSAINAKFTPEVIAHRWKE